jgi:glutathione S-transferase
VIDLYYLPGAASLAPHLVLEEVGADYRLIRVKREQGRVEPPDFARLSPHGRVPLLVDGDLAMSESAAIVMHLSDLFPESGLAPVVGTPDRAQWYRWLAYLTNTVQATFMIAFYPERTTDDPNGVDAVRTRAESALAGVREFLEAQLATGGPYLLAEGFTSADLFLFMLTRWGRRLAPKWWDQPELGAHFRRVYERPAAQRVWEQQGLDPVELRF